MRGAATALVALLALTGCTATPGPGEARIDVDTPALREAKAAAGVEPCVSGEGEPVEGGLPKVTLPCLGGGEEVDLSSLRGPLVVNLWASWCGPCREEMPILQRFHQQYGDQVPIIGIDYQDAQAEAAMDLVQETGVTYPLLADPQAALRGTAPFSGRMAVPMFAFVAGDGSATVLATRVGSVPELTDLVEQRLGVKL